MKIKPIPSIGLLIGLTASQVFAQNALIITDSSGGLGTTAANLNSKLVTAGFTVTTNAGVPGSLAGYQQIWDIRYNNPDPVTAGEMTQYLAYLSGGGSLFVMGENSGFPTRDNSIVALVTAAGGGTLTLSTPQNNQTAQSPFTGPDPVTALTFLAANGTSDPKNGYLISVDAGSIGAAIVWAPGHLLNATAGTLIVVFDVNFLDGSATAPLQALTNNMIAYLAAPTPIGPPPAPTPTLSEWGMIGLAMLLVLFGVYQIRARDVFMASQT